MQECALHNVRLIDPCCYVAGILFVCYMFIPSSPLPLSSILLSPPPAPTLQHHCDSCAPQQHTPSHPSTPVLSCLTKSSLMDWVGTTHEFSFTKSTTLFTPDRSGEWLPHCAKGRRCFNEGWQLEFRRPN